MAWCCFEALGIVPVLLLVVLSFVGDFWLCFYSSTDALQQQFLTSYYIRVAITPVLFGGAVRLFRRLNRNTSLLEAVSPVAHCAEDTIASLIGRVRASAKRRDRARLYGGVFVFLAFILQTGCSLWCGVVAVAWASESDSGWMYVSLLMVVNFEYFGLKHIYDLLTKDAGAYFPALHLHEVFFTDEAVLHRCDICGDRIAKEALRCVTCNFDICIGCFKKAAAPSATRPSADEEPPAGQVRAGASSLGQFFMRSLKLAMSFWSLIVLALVVTISTQIVTLVNPNLQGRVFDSVIRKDRPEFERLIKFYLGVQLLLGLLGSLQQWSLDLVARKLQLAGRELLFARITEQDIGFFDSTHSGQLSSRLNNDVVAMTNPARTLLNELVGNGILLVGGLILCLLTNWRLTVLALTTVVPVTYTYAQYYRISMLLNRSIWSSLSDSNEVSNETITNFRTVRSFGAEHQQVTLFNAALMLARKSGIKAAWVGASVRLFARYMDCIVSVLVLWYGGLRVLDSEASIGDLIAFQLYWNMVNGAFNGLSNVFGDLIAASSAAERVYAILDRKPEIDNTGGALLDPSIPWEVEVQNVQFTYRARKESPVLKSVSFVIPSNRVTAFVGRSGQGKSTLLHLLLRLYETQGGAITINGFDLKHLSPSGFRQHVGIVAQDTQLFSASIKENLLFGHPHSSAVTQADIVAACEAANVHSFIEELEDGYDSKIGERGILLSGGQRQRIAIARCFLRRPKIILLDEATSALDTENEALVQQALDTLIAKTQCTVVLIAHRLSTVMAAHNIVVLDRGCVVEQGTHHELVQRSGGIYAKLVAKQLTIDQDKLQETTNSGDAPASEFDKLFNAIE